MEFANIRFLNPIFFNLVYAPAILFILWVYRFWTRKKAIRRYREKRMVPAREHYLSGGKLWGWLCLIAALVLWILAMARPVYVTSLEQRDAIDVVVILDGSASSRVQDVKPDRWQRSTEWLRTFVRTLSWEGDRLALAVFARRASPFIRLTRDPNAVMFFLDHLGEEPPFSLNESPTWNTNIEEAIYWGLRLMEKDKELFGEQGNPKAFILVSDGQAWSGEAQKAVAEAVSARIPVYVVGVGTDTGGLIPAPWFWAWDEDLKKMVKRNQPSYVPIHSSLDRDSLQTIANSGRGRYFELGRGSDREIAASIINAIRRQGGRSRKVESLEELYWEVMAGAMILAAFSVFFLFKK